MKSTAIWRAVGALGVTGALMLGMSGSSMAATATEMVRSANGGNGSISITETSATQGTATWTWSGLAVGQYVSVYAAPKTNPSNTTLLPKSSGQVTKAGQYTTNITLPQGDTWTNTEVEMSESGFASGQLPEVPLAAGLPLLLLIPLGISIKRRAART
ncbi:MAG: hypothetical protein M1294_16245 [Firmicutes bacterium]|uniref:Secreted protein n=1 Tax=Sulfobacillus benefaciens TaxID=453960 RepID=A0A2T2X075_9FIRM|nr:hypothetical protein [Bacillota bacterium]MCL5014470.1 hypothetical protein [Bacillota bacterium]PSR27891.1 MAG: hypothetical protein C7B43_10925 [Sulfobacillus benefaciens]